MVDDQPDQWFVEMERRQSERLVVGARVRCWPNPECVNEEGAPRHRRRRVGWEGIVEWVMVFLQHRYVVRFNCGGLMLLSAAELEVIDDEAPGDGQRGE